MHEVAEPLIGTEIPLAIIPTGSGNGLAKHLHIPGNPALGIKVINHMQPKKIDTITLNGAFFLNIAGIGFDAHIGHKFINVEDEVFYPIYKSL